MPKITYVEFNGASHTVDVPVGLTVMEGAKKNGVPGIDADCGGGCSCGTCHVFIDEAWRDIVGPQNGLEQATLEFADNVVENSRLSCQIKVTEALDGLKLRMPESQR